MPLNMLLGEAGTGGGGTPSGLYVWYQAGTGFYTDAGTTPCTTTGDLIYQWSDQSGNNRHATQTTSARRPTYDATGFNSLACANFLESSQQWFALPSLTGITALGNGADVFIAVQAAADPPATRAGSGLWAMGSQTSGFDCSYPYLNGNVYDDALTDHQFNPIGNPTPSLTNIHVYHFSAAAHNDVAVFLDNTQLSNYTNISTFAVPSTPFIGKSLTALSYFSGKVAEYQIFDHKLTSTERGTVVSDIRSRLGF